MWLALPHESWTDLAGPGTSLWDVLEKRLGRADTDAIRASLQDCVREQRNALARFMPELSYTPSAD